MTTIDRLSDEEIKIIVARKDSLINLFADYIKTDTQFNKSISQVANLVEYRFTIIYKIIKEVLA